MTIQIIGAGMGRTGTFSLKTALEMLGYNKCYHMVELMQNSDQIRYWEDLSEGKPIDWETLFHGYEAIVDFPGASFYPEILKQYPQAKVILTVRDAEQWYDSAVNTIYKASKPGLLQKLLMSLIMPFSRRLRNLMRIFDLVDKMVWSGDFQGKFFDKPFAVGVFNHYIDQVKQAVPADQLLVYEVKQGWDPLCRFLGVPVPDQPFPRLNERAFFEEKSRELMANIIQGKPVFP
jgi:hypothetical protein